MARIPNALYTGIASPVPAALLPTRRRRRVRGAGDPHPGNILVDDTGRVALIDFGQCKIIPRELRLKLASVMIMLANCGDEGCSYNDLADAAIGLGVTFKARPVTKTRLLSAYSFVGHFGALLSQTATLISGCRTRQRM